MHRLTNKYRPLIAKLLAIWTLTIFISGVIFMHKEVTSTGEIVTHVHPYDFTKKNKKQHHSDDEIQFLNIVFHGSFLLEDFIIFEQPILTEYAISSYKNDYNEDEQIVAHYTYLLRGPPPVS